MALTCDWQRNSHTAPMASLGTHTVNLKNLRNVKKASVTDFTILPSSHHNNYIAVTLRASRNLALLLFIQFSVFRNVILANVKQQ